MNYEKITKEFFELLEDLNERDWEIKVNQNWTIKDVISHLVGWEKESCNALQESWTFKKEPWFLKTDDFSKFNETSVNNYKDYSKEMIIKEWKYWQYMLNKMIEEIKEKNLKKYPELFSWVFDEGENSHYLKHLNQIKKVLKR
jgi:hypothetical protein